PAPGGSETESPARRSSTLHKSNASLFPFSAVAGMPRRMRPHSHATHATRATFRRAVWASAVLHALVASVLALVIRSVEPRKPAERSIETRADFEPQVRMSLTESATDIEVGSQAPQSPDSAPAKPEAAPSTAASGQALRIHATANAS